MRAGKHPVPNVPFVQARNVGGPQRPTAIVLSLSQTTSDEGAALGIASNLHKPNAPLNSYHYIVDEAKTYRCIPGDTAAYSSPRHALDVLICAQPHEKVAMWEDATATLVMHRTADLVADLILAHKIRARYLFHDDEQKWLKHKWRRRGGLIVRAIGTWPYQAFLDDVKAQMTVKTLNPERKTHANS